MKKKIVAIRMSTEDLVIVETVQGLLGQKDRAKTIRKMLQMFPITYLSYVTATKKKAIEVIA